MIPEQRLDTEPSAFVYTYIHLRSKASGDVARAFGFISLQFHTGSAARKKQLYGNYFCVLHPMELKLGWHNRYCKSKQSHGFFLFPRFLVWNDVIQPTAKFYLHQLRRLIYDLQRLCLHEFKYSNIILKWLFIIKILLVEIYQISKNSNKMAGISKIQIFISFKQSCFFNIFFII